MTAKRKTRRELMAWMESHPEVWEGFPKDDAFPGAKSHVRKIAEAMTKAGLFSERTRVSQSTVYRLVSLARFARRMQQVQPKPELN